MELEEQEVARPPLLGITTIAVFAVLLVGALAFLASQNWSSEASAARIPGGGGGSAAEMKIVQGIQDQARREQEDRERRQRTLTEARVSALLADVDEVRRTVRAVQDALTEWNEFVPSLLTSDAGKRLAADPERVRAFHDLSSHMERPRRSPVEAVAERLALLEQDLEQVRSSESATLSEESEAAYAKQLQEDRAAARDAQRQLEKDLGAVKALVAQAEAAHPVQRTLAAALEELELELAAERAELIANAVREVRTEQNRLDVEMRRQAEERRAIEERRREKAKLDDETMRIAAEASEIETKTKQDALRLRAESTAVQDNYKPFLELGKTQPVNKNPASGAAHCYWKEVPGLEKKPASYAALKAARAFDRLEVFVEFATSASNDRGGAWPPLNPDDEERLAEYRERWKEFQRLAPLWIQMEKLGQ